MASSSALMSDSPTAPCLNTTLTTNTNTAASKNTSIHQLNRSIERALDEAAYTGELNLNGRKLREFPHSSLINTKCDLSDTVSADLSRNRFIEFPRMLCTFFSLERLNLYHNAIKSIPEQIVQIHMLKILDLSRNQLAYIPAPLCRLPSLEVLIIHNNKLVSLPEEIGQLKHLIELDVSSNDITQLPYQIGCLSNLRRLNIRRNMIIELPQVRSIRSKKTMSSFLHHGKCFRSDLEFCSLKLTHFDCSYNRLTRLPLNLREMVSLIELNVEHNALEIPPASICTLGLLHIMRCLLVEAMKDEKRRGLLTEHEINEKYRNSFTYQTSRHGQTGLTMRKTVVPSDSGYLTTEGSEKTLGDDDSVLSMSNEQSLWNEPTLILTLADEFSKELARQKAEYERKKCQAQQLKRHLLQQLGETENQRAKAREVARRTHDEKLAKMEKQREDARRKMENSKNIQLFNFTSKDDHQKQQRPWLSSNRTILTRQLSTVESSKMKTETFIMNEKNSNDSPNPYQRSISIDAATSTVDGYTTRSNRAVSVDPTLTAHSNDMKYLYQQKSLPSSSTIEYDDPTMLTNPCTSSSETMDQSSTSSPNLIASPKNGHHSTNISDHSLSPLTSNRLAKLRYFDDRQTHTLPGSMVPGFHMQTRVSNNANGQYQTSPLDRPGINPAFTIRRHLLQAKEDLIQIEQMKKMIEERVKVTLPDDIAYALSDGVVLCHFINQIRARAVQSIHVPSQAVPRLSLAKCRRNVENFIEASRRIGVPEVDLCTAQDIIEEKNTVRLARHIHLLVSPESFEQTNV